MKALFSILALVLTAESYGQLRPIESYRTPKRILIGLKGCYKNSINLALHVSQFIPVTVISEGECNLPTHPSIEVIQVEKVPTTFSRDWGAFWLEDAVGNSVAASFKFQNWNFLEKNLGLKRVEKRYVSTAGGNIQVGSESKCFTAYPEKFETSSSYLDIASELKDLGCSEVVRFEPAFSEKTKHVDIFFQVIAPKVVVLAEYPEGSIQNRNTMNSNLEKLVRLGYQVHRIPQPGTIAIENSFMHISYVNSLVFGDKVFVPEYGLPSDAAAFGAWEATGLEVIRVKQELPKLDGSIHCISNSLF
jgi:agmatine/peptidylarginine deiminase